jgi:hypothetical protein
MPDQGLATEEAVVQWRLKMMTTQRFANLLEMADIIGDMNPDGLEILRKIGSPEQKPLQDFLSKAKPETLAFLADLRKEEVQGLQAYLLLRSTGRYLFWGIAAIVGGLTTVLILWDRVKMFFAGSK